MSGVFQTFPHNLWEYPPPPANIDTAGGWEWQVARAQCVYACTAPVSPPYPVYLPLLLSLVEIPGPPPPSLFCPGLDTVYPSKSTFLCESKWEIWRWYLQTHAVHRLPEPRDAGGLLQGRVALYNLIVWSLRVFSVYAYTQKHILKYS